MNTLEQIDNSVEYARRQPVYVLVNLTAFEGNQIVDKCNKIIADFIAECKKEPYLQETGFVNVYQVEWNHLLTLCDPMTKIAGIDEKKISIKKTLGIKDNNQLVTLLQQVFEENKRKETCDAPEDYQPVMVLLTDCKNYDYLCSAINPLMGTRLNIMYETESQGSFATNEIIPIVVAGDYETDGIVRLSRITLSNNNANCASEIPQLLKF